MKNKITLTDKNGTSTAYSDFILFALDKEGIKTTVQWDKATYEEELRMSVTAQRATNELAKYLVKDLLDKGIPEETIKKLIVDIPMQNILDIKKKSKT